MIAPSPARTLSGALALCILTGGARADEPVPVDQALLNRMVASAPLEAFLFAFEAGDELTEAVFTAARGVGANVGLGQRFTRLPRADLDGAGEWAAHFPPREGGPQAQSCITCHSVPLANGAGGIALNVAVDPLQTGDPAAFLERNTLPLFGLGAVQLLAEEMTAELHAAEATLSGEVCRNGAAGEVVLQAKGIDFGVLRAVPEGAGEACVARIDTAGVAGVDEDLVIRAFGWKGTAATIREFSRGAAHNEMGMQAVELVGHEDGDYDGVTNELSIGDMTAMTIYMAGLERPTSRLELDALGLVPLDPAERAVIEAGEDLFAEIGCASCHVPALTIGDPVFREPSATPGFVETVLPSGAEAETEGLIAASAVTIDLTRDAPNNRIPTEAGEVLLGAYEIGSSGGAVVRIYSDLKRHDMGPALSDPVDAFGFGASVWPTRSLAGVGSTGPWLHNGHATTLDEAILFHGGEAAAAQAAYASLAEGAKAELIAFLDNQIIVNLDPGEDETD